MFAKHFEDEKYYVPQVPGIAVALGHFGLTCLGTLGDLHYPLEIYTASRKNKQ